MKKNFGKVAFSVGSIFLLGMLPTGVLAGDVSISGTVQVQLTATGIIYELASSGNASSVSITTDSFTITTGVADTVTVSSTDGKALQNNGGLIATCVGTVTQLAIPVSTLVTVTPTNANVCVTPGGGSAPAPTTSTTPVAVAPATTPVTTPTTPVTPTTPADTLTTTPKLVFKDVVTTGKNKLTAAQAEAILQIIQKMIDSKNYKVNSKKTFSPKSKADATFALQVALSLAGKDCGKNINYGSCKNAALANKLITKNELKKTSVNLGEYLSLLLKAKGVPLVTDKKIIAKNLCSDIKATNKLAAVIATAKTNKILTGACKTSASVLRSDATVFASKVDKLVPVK